MLKLRKGIKIYVSVDSIDARKSIDGLSALVAKGFATHPQSGDLFIFFNKKRDKVKIIYWDNNGFILHYKRLEKHRFHLPQLQGLMHLEINEIQLEGLLAGLDFNLMRQFPELTFHQYI